MNRIYRLVWSHVQQTWVIVSERTRGQGKKASRKLAAAAALAAVSSLAMAGPSGGQVTAGSGSISQSGNTTTINQGSQNLSLNWQSFNTASGETVNFVQPSASAIAVNRISDTSATQFFGNLNANGQVYLVNPNGILFGAGSQVNVGGLVASTLDINDAALGSASRNFNGAGAGSIVNRGAINAANGGYVAFLGKQVSNQGTITTPGGTTALAAGSDVTLSFAGNSLVNLQINQSTLETLAENGGLIKADGGAVLMSAGARDAVLASVVNNTGIIQAKSVQNVNGTIVLEAGANGTASNSGTLDASGKLTGETGGTVKVLGGTTKLAAHSQIDVSGDAGGGTALVGGNYQGGGNEQRSTQSIIEAGSVINADAITSGNGGTAVVWSDGTTQFDGSITARGGRLSGNGGQAETSAKNLNINASASVNTTAAHGTAGNWLLDPDDITIGNLSIWGNSYGVNVDTRVLTNALNNGNVTIKTTGSSASCSPGLACTGTSGNGDIFILDPIGLTSDYAAAPGSVAYWTNTTTLTLSAYRNVQFKFTSGVTYPGVSGTNDTAGSIYVNSGGGSVVLRADNTAKGTGTVKFDDSTSNSQNLIILDSGTVNLYYNSTNNGNATDYSQNVLTQYNAYMAINLTGSATSKVYDGLKTTGVSGVTSLSTLPSGLTLNTASAQGLFDDKNAGTGKAVTITGVTATGSGAVNSTNSDGYATVSYGNNNYYFNGTASITANISKADLVMSGVSAANKTYDATTTAVLTGTASVTGLQNDLVSVTGTGTGTFNDANAGTRSVTVTGYTLGGTDAGNYNLLQPTGLTATINKANLTLSGTKTYDTTTTVAGSTLTATGVAGQTFTVTGSGNSDNLASKNVQTNSALSSVTGLALGASSNGGLSSNYNVLSTTGSSYTVTPKSITLSGITAVDKVYDATTSATLNTSSLSYSGLLPGDSVSLSGASTGTFTNGKDVGINKAVSVSGFTLGGTDGGNYVLTQPTGLTASISKANLVVSGISAADKTYDATSSATLTGTASVNALLSDVVSVTGTGTGTFNDANAGTRLVTVTGYTLSGTDANNYNVVQPSTVSATINKANLTLSGTRTYDGTTAVAGSTLTATGVAGQTFAVTGSGDASNLTSKNVQSGSVLSSVTGLALGSSSNGGLSSNYNVLSTSGSSYTVTAKGITLAGITAADKTYDGSSSATLNTTNVSYSGLISGDDVNLSGTGTGTFTAGKDAGVNKAVTVSGYTISGNDAGNYVVTQPSGLTATISKANLALGGLSVSSKTYDGGTAAALSGTASVTAIGADVVSLGGIGVANFDNKNVGTGKSILISGYALSGTDAGNYNLVAPGNLTADITPLQVIISGIIANNKTYDGTTTATTNTSGVNIAGKVAGDVVTVSSTGAFTDKNAGNNKPVNLTNTFGGADAGNYTFVNQATAQANIAKADVTVSGVSAAGKTYDGTVAAALNGTASVNAFGNDVIAVSGGTGTFADKNAGANKAVTVTGYALTGADAANYNLLQPTGLTASINKADLTVAGVSAANKIYDGTVAATLNGTASVSALGNDVVTLSGGTASFADKNVGTGKAVTVNGYTLAGADAGNYNLAQPSGLRADIAQANLNVAGITAANKLFDGTTAATVSTNAATLGGLVAGDRVALASSGAFADAAAGAGKTVNLSNSISGADSGNYRLTGQTTTLADITAASTPIPSQAIQNVVTQVQSAVLPPQAAVQPQSLDASSTIVVNQPQQASAPNNSERSNEGTASRSPINTTTGFGTPAPTLNIQNGGVQLPPLATSITQ